MLGDIGKGKRQKLEEAVRRGEEAAVLRLLSRSKEPQELLNSQDEAGCTALHRAIELGRIDMVRLLLDQGANFVPAKPLPFGWSLETDLWRFDTYPLHFALREGHEDIARLLAACGHPMELPSITDPDLTTSCLVNICRDPGSAKDRAKPLAERADYLQRCGCLPKIRTLLTLGADPSFATPYHEGETALHLVVRKPHATHLEAARLLLEAGADVNAGDRQGRTPLFLVGSIAMLRLLIEAGADPSQRNHAGLTPKEEVLKASPLLLDSPLHELPD